MMNTKKRILLVEDDPDVRLGIATLLSRRFEVIECEDGTSTMVALRKHRPDALILDLGLPGGDGQRVLRWLAELPEFSDMPKLVVTGRDLDSARPEALANGADMVFAKPADIEMVADAIDIAVATPASAQLSVLVVEDDDDCRMAFEAGLRQAGFKTTSTSDAATALMRATRSRPDAIVLDLGLPAGGGRNLLDRLKANPDLRSVPVVVATGEAVAADDAELLAHGAVRVLNKPMEPDALVQALEDALACLPS